MQISKKKEESGLPNPALTVSNFYTFSLSIVNEINFARSNPRTYILKLKELKNKIDLSSNTLYIKGYPYTYSNLEESLNSAIDFLSDFEPVQPLEYSTEITNSANEFLEFLILHDGMNMDEMNNPNITLEKRMNSYGEAYGEIFELIDYGMFDPEYIVINFILGDSDPEKTERSVIFSPGLTKVGAACGILPSDRICTVINFAEKYFAPGEEVNEKEKKKYQTKTLTYSKETYNHNKAQLSQNQPPQKLTRRVSGDLFKYKRNEFIKNNSNIESIQKKEIEKKIKPIPSNYEIEEENLPDDAVNVSTTEKIIKNQDGETVKLVKKITTYKDGRVDTQLFKEPVTSDD